MAPAGGARAGAICAWRSIARWNGGASALSTSIPPPVPVLPAPEGEAGVLAGLFLVAIRPGGLIGAGDELASPSSYLMPPSETRVLLLALADGTNWPEVPSGRAMAIQSAGVMPSL